MNAPEGRFGSDSVIRRCRLDVRFAQKRTRLGDFLWVHPSLTPLADLGRSARQAPLHGLHAAGVAAAGDDAKISARLFERGWIDVGLGGRRLDHAHGLRPRCERVLEEALGTLAAFWRLHLSIRRARL